MNKTELKALIKECVKEVIFEDGALRSIVTEVAQGLGGARQVVTEAKVAASPSKSEASDRETVRAKLRAAMMGSQPDPYEAATKTKLPNAHLFEGTTPLDDGASNSGVDISNLPGLGNWGTISNRLKKG
jgi:hypothetical protein